MLKECGIAFKSGVVNDFSCYIKVKDLEEIISPIMRKALIWNGEKNLQITSSLSQLEPEIEKQVNNNLNLPFKIKCKSDIDLLLDKFQDFVINVAEPFFEKWSDLRVLNDFIETIPQRQITKYLGMSATFKKILIFKLCNNPKYKDEFERVYNKFTKRYQENPNGDRSYKQWNDAVILLKEALDNVEPIYNM